MYKAGARLISVPTSSSLPASQALFSAATASSSASPRGVLRASFGGSVALAPRCANRIQFQREWPNRRSNILGDGVESLQWCTALRPPELVPVRPARPPCLSLAEATVVSRRSCAFCDDSSTCAPGRLSQNPSSAQGGAQLSCTFCELPECCREHAKAGRWYIKS